MIDTVPAGRIGPNAVIRLAEAVDALESRPVTVKLFDAVDLGRHLSAPPATMLPEAEVTALHHQLRSTLGPQRAASATWIAGIRTADYLLANRIPLPAQRLLKLLPARLAAYVLLKTIGSHSWTFAGSSRYSWRMGRPITLSFEDCPLCRGETSALACCNYYAATFERLFRVLITPRTEVEEVQCAATGAPACRFEIRY